MPQQLLQLGDPALGAFAFPFGCGKLANRVGKLAVGIGKLAIGVYELVVGIFKHADGLDVIGYHLSIPRIATPQLACFDEQIQRQDTASERAFREFIDPPVFPATQLEPTQARAKRVEQPERYVRSYGVGGFAKQSVSTRVVCLI